MPTDESKKRKVLARKRWREANPEKQRAISREQSRKWRAANPTKGRDFAAKWRQNNPDEAKARARRQHYKTNYGITPEERDAMLRAQGGMCAACGRLADRWHVDHCHKTKKIRGVLCHHCNLALGHARDDVAILAKLINYLGKYK